MKFNIGDIVTDGVNEFLIEDITFSPFDENVYIYGVKNLKTNEDDVLTAKRLTKVIKKWEPKTFNDKLILNRAWDRRKQFNRLMAWVDEFVPDAEFEFCIGNRAVGFDFICPPHLVNVFEKLEADIENGVVEL